MQLTYNFNPSVGVAGMVAESRESNVIVSKVASGAVPVGLLCYPGADSEIGMSPTTADPAGTSPGQVVAWPANVNDSPLLRWESVGIPVYDASRPPYDANNCYADKDPVPVITKGPVWVKPEGSFSDEKRLVYVRTAVNGGLTTLGGFAGSAGAGLVILPNAKWLSGCNANGLAILELW